MDYAWTCTPKLVATKAPQLQAVGDEGSTKTGQG